MGRCAGYDITSVVQVESRTLGGERMKFPFVSRRKYKTAVDCYMCLRRIVDLIGSEERKRLGLLPTEKKA